MPAPSSDRRGFERFDVVGVLWGVLALPEPARIVNISMSGALIDSPVGPVPGSSQCLRLLVAGDSVRVNALVRHVVAERPGRFLVGLEFVAPPTSVLSLIEQIDHGAGVEIFDCGP